MDDTVLDDDVGHDDPGRSVTGHDVRARVVGGEHELLSSGRDEGTRFGELGGEDSGPVDDLEVTRERHRYVSLKPLVCVHKCAGTYVVGQDPLNLSLVQLRQRLRKPIQRLVRRRKDRQPHSLLQRLQKPRSLDDPSETGQQLPRGLTQGGGEGEDLVDNVNLEVGSGSVGGGINVPSGLLDDNPRPGRVAAILLLGLGPVTSVEDDGDGKVAVEHHVVVQAPDDRMSGPLGNVSGGHRGVEDVEGEDVGEEGGVGRDLGGDGGKGVVVGGYRIEVIVSSDFLLIISNHRL